MRVLREKEQRLVVGNLQAWAKIDLEGKQRHNSQEPGLLGTAGEGASQAPLIRKPSTVASVLHGYEAGATGTGCPTPLLRRGPVVCQPHVLFSGYQVKMLAFGVYPEHLEYVSEEGVSSPLPLVE